MSDFRRGMKQGMSLQNRLARMTDRSGGPDACWRWLGSLTKQGYGRFNLDGDIRRAHEVSYRVFVGPVPEGHVVCHVRSCNHKWCVNPKHLYAGTPSQNTQDALALGWKPPLNPNPYRDENHRFTSSDLAVYVVE